MTARDHPFAGIRAKIERADESIHNLNTEINTLINGDTYTLISILSDDATKRSIRIVGPEPPLRFAVLAGEIVYHLRSSLDHLVRSLVVNNNNIPGRNHQYPICSTPESFKEASDQKRGLQGISSSAKAIIESRQPYRSTESFERHFLHILQELNNADKHRLLVVLVTRIPGLHRTDYATERGRSESDSVNIINFYPWKSVQGLTGNGIEILRIGLDKPEPDLKTMVKPILHIAFGDFGLMTKQPIIYILSQVRDKVVGLIDSFESEFSLAQS